MTKEQMAAVLNGRQYGDEITKEEEIIALKAGACGRLWIQRR